MPATLEAIGVIRELANHGLPASANRETSGEDQLAITLELRDASSAGRKYKGAELAKVTGVPTQSSKVCFPALLSGELGLHMSRGDLVEEIDLLFDIGDADTSNEILVYSLQVLEPRSWAWPEDGPSPNVLHPNAGRQAELRNGYVYHEVLRQIPTESRTPFLESLLRSAKVIEVSIRRGSQHMPLHVRVELE
jgi:hypothetical protein